MTNFFLYFLLAFYQIWKTSSIHPSPSYLDLALNFLVLKSVPLVYVVLGLPFVAIVHLGTIVHLTIRSVD